ncbi:MAG: hypothetical protein IKS28_05675 [Clostridia bacterium]|nr:hypothetical protein [Clostridia bacterium]
MTVRTRPAAAVSAVATAVTISAALTAVAAVAAAIQLTMVFPSYLNF